MKQILWLLIVALLIVGCAKPYLPPEFRTACEMRLIELDSMQDLGDPNDPCCRTVALDREFLNALLEASK